MSGAKDKQTASSPQARLQVSGGVSRHPLPANGRKIDMTRTHEPRRRPDGSLDTAHYIALGRRHRALKTRSLLGALHPGRRH
jgi:hypothetical protein